MTKIETSDEVEKISRGVSLLVGVIPDGWTKKAHMGCVMTPHCVVAVMASYGDDESPPDFEMTLLMICRDGEMHKRYYDKRYTRRGIITKARQFAAEFYSDTEDK